MGFLVGALALSKGLAADFCQDGRIDCWFRIRSFVPTRTRDVLGPHAQAEVQAAYRTSPFQYLTLSITPVKVERGVEISVISSCR